MRFTSLILSLLISVSAIAQNQSQSLYTKGQLEAKRKELMEGINETEKQLIEIKNNKNTTLGQLRALQNKLAQRQSLIGNINDEIGNIDNTIKSSSKEVVTLKQKLELSKIRYAQSIRYAYQSRSSYDMLAFLFSSSDFNDAMRRMKYLKKFRDLRKQQVEQIKLTQNQLQHKIGELSITKAQKDELLNKQVLQKQDLMKETDQTNQVIQQLKGKESELKANIERNRIIAARVNKAINAYIEAEMAKEAKRAADAQKIEDAKNAALAKANPSAVKTPAKPAATVPTATNPASTASSTKLPKVNNLPLLLTPTDVKLAANFEENKGRLYWPVEKGYITDHFGVHSHPVYTHVMIDNPGIDIQTDNNAGIRSVFDGTVFKVFSADGGSTQIVMIKHGNYFTVYNGLSNVSVQKDDHVTPKQVIGHVAINEENIPLIKFQIWKWNGKSNVTLNPEAWIGKVR
jgi:septal ring factor EnvC (AmiA/AmiB activator)